MTDKRFFAHSETVHFKDYLQNKKSVEMLKNIRSKQSGKINRFLNYEQFIGLTKSYFRYLAPGVASIQIPVGIYHSNSSFLIYQSLLSHIKDCTNCRLCKDVYMLSNCKEVKQILYPYGKYIDTTSSPVLLHNRFDLGDWCIKCNVPDDDVKHLHSHSNDAKVIEGCENCSQGDHPSMYNRSKNVFPSQNTFVIEDIASQEDPFIQEQRMNAFAFFPNIKFCGKLAVETKETKPNLCGKTRPLFI